MIMTLKDKKVFITGATRGIGSEISHKFYKLGAKVYGTGTKEAKFDYGFLHITDFSNLDDIKACSDFVSRVEPDILINNAGINFNQLFEEIDLDVFLKIQQVNVLAPLLLMQAALPGMRKKRWGRIINISSIWGKISMAGRASYSASKFALDGMTTALASECAKDGILVNCVAPGFTNTELTAAMLGAEGVAEMLKKVPLGRMAEVSEIAELVMWLSSNKNTYISGQNIAIDGGFTRV